jgi:hypothetical protein
MAARLCVAVGLRYSMVMKNYYHNLANNHTELQVPVAFE